MHREQPLYRFDFENNFFPNKEVDSVMGQKLAAVTDGVPLLAFERNAGLTQLDDERAGIDLLAQARTQRPVHCDAAADQIMNRLLDRIREGRRNP